MKLLILMVVMLSGCGNVDRLSASVTGYSKMCIANVEYLQFTSGASVAYTTEGKVKTCK